MGRSPWSGRRVAALAAASMLAAVTAPQALAHHGTAQEFDLQRTVTLRGVVSRVDWMNPHIYFALDVTGPDGKVEQYMIETVPVAFARKAKITKAMMMDEGRVVEVDVAPGKKDPHRVWARRLKLSDGRVLTLSGN